MSPSGRTTATPSKLPRFRRPCPNTSPSPFSILLTFTSTRTAIDKTASSYMVCPFRAKPYAVGFSSEIAYLTEYPIRLFTGLVSFTAF